MVPRKILLTLAALAFSAGLHAQPGGALPPVDDNAPIFGSQMMTEQERIEHRDRMRAARSLEEREAVRAEHHERMVERARERGITLPDEPPPRGSGYGASRGMGPGGGVGPGGGRGMGADGMPPGRNR